MKFEGEVHDADLLRMILELAHGGFTGAIRFERDDIIKILYLKDGQFLSASTNDRTDSLDEILLKGQKVSKEHIRQALARRKEDESLGDALLGLGFITRRELSWVRRVQLVGILRSLLGWDSGSYTLVHDYLPRRDEGTAFAVAPIVVEVVVTSDDRGAVEGAIDGGDAIFSVAPGGRETFDQLGLNEDAEQLLELVDGRRTAVEIASATPKLDGFSVYKLLRAFSLIGVVERAGSSVSPTAPVGADEFDWEAAPELPLPSFSSAGPSELPHERSDASAAETAYDFESDSSVKDSELLPDVGPDEFEARSSLNMPERFDLDPEPAGSDRIHRDEPLAAPPASRPIIPMAAPQGGRVRATPSPYRGGGVPQKRSGRGIALAAVAGLLLVGAGLVWWFLLRDQSGPSPVPAVAASTEPEVVPVETFPAASETAEIEGPPEPQPVEVVSEATEPAQVVTEDAPAASGASSDVAWSWQVGFFCQESSRARALEQGGPDAWALPVTRDGQQCYRVFWGRFDDDAAARAAAGRLPEAFRGQGAIIVSPRRLAR